MSRKKIIYTSADSNTPYYWKYCRDTVEAWADRCGAELVNLPKPEGYQPQWVLFDAFKHSQDSDADAIWIDCDIVVKDTAPNLFDTMPDKFLFCPPDPPRRIHPKMRRGYEKWGMLNPRPYVITALVQWTPRHVEGIWEWFLENKDRFNKNQGDQELLTVALYDLERHHALYPNKLHRMHERVDKDAQFLHSAGSRKGRKLKEFRRKIGREETITDTHS